MTHTMELTDLRNIENLIVGLEHQCSEESSLYAELLRTLQPEDQDNIVIAVKNIIAHCQGHALGVLSAIELLYKLGRWLNIRENLEHANEKSNPD